jgi:hypothetical protein
MDYNLYITEEEIAQSKHKVISFGAGTQSTALLLMGLNGDLHGRPDCAVFADTGAEPAHVYEYLGFMQEFVKKEYDFDIATIKYGDIYEDLKRGESATGKRFASIPAFAKTPNGEREGMLRRQCTYEYKILPIKKYMKKNFNIRRKNKEQENIIELQMGISLDEIQRMKVSQEWFYYHRYPLIDKDLKRSDSIDYVKKFGLPEPPRSSCTFCPFHSDSYFRWLKNNYPEDFEKACQADEMIRIDKRGKITAELYVHRSLKPLREVDLRSNKEKGMLTLWDDGMINECEGYCGI